MIVYKDMCFCMREGCKVKKCPRNLVHVNWSFGLPVHVSDFWGKRDECPEKEPKKAEVKHEAD